MKATVRLTSDTVSVERTLGVGESFVLGRSPQTDVVLDDLRASRRHCRVELAERVGLVLHDERSANGTHLNGKLLRKALLRSGDRISIGQKTLTATIRYEGFSDAGWKCDACAAKISLSAFAAGEVISIEDGLLCLECRHTRSVRALSPGDVACMQALDARGFEVLGKISVSHPATTWKAVKRSMRQLVAIKTLEISPAVSRERRERFAREAHAAEKLRHPNIVTVFDAKDAGSILYIVMELIEGQTLGRQLARGDRLPVRDALRVGHQIARAIDHAHERGIVHRDVKPLNIMIGPEGDAKLIDFGLARNLWERDVAPSESRDALGTYGYMAPEQAKESDRIDARADVYGLGATLYHCLAGKPPFAGADLAELKSRIAAGESPRLPPLAGAPPEVLALVARMMSPRPDERGSAREVLRAIEQVVNSISGFGELGDSVEFVLSLRDEPLDRAGGDRALAGRFDHRELDEFLRMIERGGRSGRIEVADDVLRGRVHVVNGRIVAAEAWPIDLMKGRSADTAPVKNGMGAVVVLLGIDQGQIEFVPLLEDLVPQCDIGISESLLEGEKARSSRKEGRIA